jgi:hypothetical protein
MGSHKAAEWCDRGFAAAFLVTKTHIEMPFSYLLDSHSETVWKIAWRVLDRLCLVAQEGEMGHLRPVLATRYTPDEAYSDFPDSLIETVRKGSKATSRASIFGPRAAK